MIWLSPSWRKLPYRKGLSISLGNTTFTIQFWYELAHSDLLIQLRQTVSPTDFPIYDSHRNYEIMQIRNIFAKQVFSTRLAKQIRYRAWPNIFDNPAHHTFVSDTLIYNCFIDAVMLGSFEILQNANTWHFSPLFLMYIFGA